MNALAASGSDSLSPETEIIAREVAGAFGRMVRWYREYYKLSPEEARQRAAETASTEYEELLKERPPEEVSWEDLEYLSRGDPSVALRRWEDVKRAALVELQTGHRSAMALEAGGSRCWQRAQFSALYAELAEQWQPRNGIERQLIDTMAQAQSCYFVWLEKLMVRSTLESHDPGKRELKERGWVTPRLSEAEAIEQAAGMMDRFNRMFLRTLRSLQELRRHSPQVIVQNAGQVNIAEKQVNVA